MDIEYLHLYVRDAVVWRDWFVETLNFRPIPTTVVAGLGEFAVQSAEILVLLSSEQTGNPEVQQFLRDHPEGVGDVAFRVRDLRAIAQRIAATGAYLTQPIQEQDTPMGPVRWCRVQGWGGVSHTLMQRLGSPGGMISPTPPPQPQTAGALPWLRIDHAVLNVPAGQLEAATDWYERHLGFAQQQQFVIETPRSGLRSRVLQHPEGSAKLPVNEPTSDNSQIQEFLDLHGGAGIQHVALQTQDLVQTVAFLRQRDVSFLSVPTAYYEQLRERAGFWQEAGDWVAIAAQEILVDWPLDAPQTRLLQTFTLPPFEQPTFFWEFIERQALITARGIKCAEGFGEGNFQALFEAIEREQQQRGSLE